MEFIVSVIESILYFTTSILELFCDRSLNNKIKVIALFTLIAIPLIAILLITT